jgi:hypothetical protein
MDCIITSSSFLCVHVYLDDCVYFVFIHCDVPYIIDVSALLTARVWQTVLDNILTSNMSLAHSRVQVFVK